MILSKDGINVFTIIKTVVPSLSEHTRWAYGRESLYQEGILVFLALRLMGL